MKNFRRPDCSARPSRLIPGNSGKAPASAAPRRLSAEFAHMVFYPPAIPPGGRGSRSVFAGNGRVTRDKP